MMTDLDQTIGRAGSGRTGSGRKRNGGHELRADLRSMIPDATAGLVVTAGIFAWLYWRVADGSSATIQVMPSLADAGKYWMYWLCQAFGWSALLWAWITVMLGLLRSSGLPMRSSLSVARVERWHRTTSLTTIALTFGHAALFFAERVRDNADGLGWAGRWFSAFTEVFVPGVYSSGTGRTAILIGLLAFYLSIPLGLAYYLRRRIGSRAWRVLHRFVIVVYVLSVWHTLLYGTNVWYDGWFRTTVWLLQLPVAALFLARLLTPGRPRERLRAPAGSRKNLLPYTVRLAGRIIVAAAVVVLVAVSVTGRDGGRTPGGESTTPAVTAPMIWAGFAVLALALAAAVWTARRDARVPATGR
jgi:hypothetical protein